MTRTPPPLRLSALLLAAAAAAACASRLPPLPPLNDPSTDLRIPGKVVWVDLFTNDLETARNFYTRLFDWEWRWVSEDPDHPYGVFTDHGLPVAGVAFREATSEKHATYGRWVYYLSTPDVARASERTLARGGRALLTEREIPERGDLAVLADPEGAPFGALRSSSGDPPDYRADFGEWLWVALASWDAAAASKFYESVFGYEVRDVQDESEILEYILASGGHARAGIGQLDVGSGAKPTWIGFVRVEDLDASLAKAAAAGGEVLLAPTGGGGRGDLAIVADPLGAPIGLMEWSYDAADGAQEPRS